MNNKQKIRYIIDWIKTYASNTAKPTKSLIVGVSGGIDSALTSTLCAMSGLESILIRIPIKSKDISLSREHCDYLIDNFDGINDIVLYGGGNPPPVGDYVGAGGKQG